jgi:hypothetical protein
VPEQRGHGEPVGEGADHGGLGRGVDVPPHAVLVEVQGGDEDDRGQAEQRHGDEPHPPQTGTARGILG